MERKTKRLVILAPTYNEEENIKNFLIAVLAEKENLPDYKLLVLVSDSHSLDRTKRIVLDMARRHKEIYYLDVKKRGLGLGLVLGLDYAVTKLKADYIITMEADLSNSPSQIVQFVQKLKKYDLVVGSRYCDGGKIVNWSWWRRGFSLGANYLLRILILTTRIHEFTNLYRAFDARVWSLVRDKIIVHNDWIFVPAFVITALNEKISICEQPIIYYDRFGGRSKMRTLSYTKNLLRYVLRYRWQKLTGTYVRN